MFPLIKREKIVFKKQHFIALKRILKNFLSFIEERKKALSLNKFDPFSLKKKSRKNGGKPFRQSFH